MNIIRMFRFIDFGADLIQVQQHNSSDAGWPISIKTCMVLLCMSSSECSASVVFNEVADWFSAAQLLILTYTM